MLSSAILRIGIMVFGLVSLATATPLPTENNALGQVPCAADMECPTNPASMPVIMSSPPKRDGDAIAEGEFCYEDYNCPWDGIHRQCCCQESVLGFLSGFCSSKCCTSQDDATKREAEAEGEALAARDALAAAIKCLSIFDCLAPGSPPPGTPAQCCCDLPPPEKGVVVFGRCGPCC